MAESSQGGSSSDHSNEITPEQEYFLYELETSDAGSIGLVLRAIYDGGDVQKFIAALERKIRHYDKDIERLCNFHYQGFIEAIRELLQVKQECDSLRSRIEETNLDLQDCSKSLLQKGEDIVKYRKMQKNIASAIDSISLCLPMLEKYSKLQEQMTQKRYYPALKTLEQLEHTYFTRLGDYRFVQQLKTGVNEVRKEIKKASDKEFTDFLENIHSVTGRVGEVTLRHIAERHSIQCSLISANKRRPKYNLPQSLMNGSVSSGLPGSPASSSPGSQGNRSGNAGDGNVSTQEEDEFIAQDIIDFQPVYRCCHITSVLGQKEKFESDYRKQRREQANMVLKSPENLKHALEGFLKYFHEVVGFFVIEDTVMKTAPGLVTRTYRDELWEMALQQVSKTLNSHFGNCTDAEIMLKIKELILIFALSMKDYGFQVLAFYKLLQNFREQYNEILMRQCCQHFEDILRHDNYTPIAVEAEADYKAVTDRFPIYNRSLQEEPFPKRFPFSEFVPSIYEQVKTYIKGSFKFMEKLGLTQTDVDDAVRRSTNLLLERLSGCLKEYISTKNLTLVQLIQITINMGYLEKSCESLESYVTKLIGISQSSTHAVKLKQGAHMFTDARSEVEHQIYNALNRKITDFLELANYEWEMTEAEGRASDYVTDLVAYLHSMFKSFTNLPVSLARAACMSACKHLASQMMGMLMDPDVKCLTMGALEQFNLDVIQCEQFASMCPVPGFEDGTLLLTFADLRQLLDLLMSYDWSSYLADYGKERSRYVRVNPATTVAILEKIMEADRRKNSFFGRGKDKDKQKLLDTVLRQLKGLVANGAA